MPTHTKKAVIPTHRIVAAAPHAKEVLVAKNGRREQSTQAFVRTPVIAGIVTWVDGREGRVGGVTWVWSRGCDQVGGWSSGCGRVGEVARVKLRGCGREGVALTNKGGQGGRESLRQPGESYRLSNASAGIQFDPLAKTPTLNEDIKQSHAYVREIRVL